MIASSKPAVRPSHGTGSARPSGRAEGAADGFEGDLRDALASTVVREASFEEFRRVLQQFMTARHGHA